MPFPFTIPTTSFVSFSHYFSSNSHPSLPFVATSSRTVVRDALKRHKRLPPFAQPANLPTLKSAIESYLPYLFALEAGLSGATVAGEEIDVVLLRELQVTWRAPLTSSGLGRNCPRVQLQSLDSDIFFALQALACVHTLLARDALHPLYRTDASPMESSARAQLITQAMKHLLSANAVHRYLLQRASTTQNLPTTTPVDISIPVLGALSSLALAEATLIAVLKDDPYPVAISEERNKNSTDWMFKAPNLETKRLNILVRICIAAADHASASAATLRNAKGVNEELVTYVDDLGRTARAKAARFQAIASDQDGKSGEAIAWIRGAKKELGFTGDDESKSSGISKIKRGWMERKEEKKIKKGDSDWGADAGRFEEGRVLDMLEKKWVKMNDTVSCSVYSCKKIPAHDISTPCNISRHLNRYSLACLEEGITMPSKIILYHVLARTLSKA
jgi:hypothetical protein